MQSNPRRCKANQSDAKQLKAVQNQKEGLDGACDKIQTTLTEHQAALRKHNNEYVDILLEGISEYRSAYQQFSDALASTQPEVAHAALQIGPALGQVFRSIDNDHENLMNSPGRKRIGIVCGHGEFCPFREDKPLVQKELGANSRQ